MNDTEYKSNRMLQIYSDLLRGKTLKKKELAERFHVAERSIQRDMEALRIFLTEQNAPRDVVYSRKSGGYYLERKDLLNNSEILAVCKILLESRSMRKDELFPILDRLLDCCVPEENKKAVNDLLKNEKFHYLEPHHGQSVLDKLWEIGQAARNCQVLKITYERLKEPKQIQRIVEPVGIMFSEYYFYLTAFVQSVDRKAEFENPDDRFPTIYRIDRIRDFQVLPKHFKIPYKDRFEEGEFRKRVQFMYGGKLQTVKFCYTGPSLEAVLDRLPTAEILRRDADGWIIQAEVFGKGIDMWLRSQGEYIVLCKDV